MKLFFDTETTGLCDFKLPPDHPSQPHMVSCAAVMTDDDLNELQSIRLIAEPDGVMSGQKAIDAHGITHEMQLAFGIPRIIILSAFCALAKKCDERIAFNYDYDELVITGELMRLNKPHPFDRAKAFCEMKAMTDICRIPSPYRAGQFKWPNLQEAHKHAFGKEFEKAHDAMADVRATIAISRWRRMGQRPASADLFNQSITPQPQ